MARIFLSHASVDKPVVRQIAAKLRAAGHEPWIDEEEILIGESIPAAVERGLRQADFVVVCLSLAAASRGWVEAERDATLMQQFRERKSRILPVRLEDVSPPYLISQLAYADLFPHEANFELGMSKLVKAIAQHSSDSSPDSEAQRKRFASVFAHKHKLSDEARRLLEERPFAWEALFFSRVLSDELDAIADLRRDLKLGLARGPILRLDDKEMFDWMPLQFRELQNVAGAFTALVNQGFNEAIGKPGQPSDLEQLVHVAKRIIDGCRTGIEWTFRWRRLYVDDEFHRVIELAQTWGVNMISDMEGWINKVADDLQKWVASPQGDFHSQAVLSEPEGAEEFQAELQRLTRVYTRRR